MRICRYASADDEGLGLIDGDDRVVPLQGASILDLIEGEGPTPDAARPSRRLGEVELLEPHQPCTILGIGLNYREHARETGKTPPDEPMVFVKLPAAINGPTGVIERPAYTRELDYEGELAVVIGDPAWRVSVDHALEHVFGYAVMNDVSARDRQRDEPRWIRAKGGDTFAPFGPWITTADEVADPQDLRIRTWVNDELRQDGNTSDMVFSVARLISWCSHQFTLGPGDVITTGTPAGVGVGFDPPRFLVPGDRVTVTIDGLGTLEHRVVDAA